MTLKQEIFILDLWIDYGVRLNYDKFRLQIVRGDYNIRVYQDGYYFSYNAYNKFGTDKRCMLVLNGLDHELEVSIDLIKRLRSLLVWGRYNDINPFKLKTIL